MAASSDDIDSRLAEAKKIAEDMKADLAKRKKEARDTTLFDTSRGGSSDTKSKIIARRTLKGHLAKIYSLNWCADSQQLVSAAQDGKLIVWHAQSTNKVHAIGLQSVWVMTCGYSPTGSLVASGGLDNCCSIYNLRSLDPNNHPNVLLSHHTGFLSCVRFESDSHVLTGSGDSTCIKWDVNTQKDLITFAGHGGDVICLALSPDRNTFISGACDWTSKLWDIRTGKCVTTFRGHEADINSCAFFPSGNAFATGSDDAHVFLWDIRSGQDIQRFKNDETPPSGITSVDFSLSGKYLFSGYDDFQTRIWDTCTREVVGVLASHTNRVSCLGVPPSGEAISTGSWDTNLKIYA